MRSKGGPVEEVTRYSLLLTFWLPKKMINSVYIHIPFCVRKCLYCDFNSYPGKEELYEPYVEGLKAEIRRDAARFPDARISTVYFGGGTPNVLSPDQLESILAEIRDSFDVAWDAEITTEANPAVGRQPPAASIEHRVSSIEY